MSWLGSLIKSTPEARSGSLENPSVPLSAATIADLGGGSAGMDAGVSVTPYTALGYAPVYQAVSMISGDCAKMPMKLFRKTDKGREEISSHEVSRLVRLGRMVNPEVNSYKFWRRFFTSALLYGNAFAYIERDRAGKVLGLYNLLPDRTTPARYKGRLYYVTEVNRSLEAFDAADILHVEGLTLDNLAGADFIRLFREDFGIALARRRFTAKFFKNNMTAGGILTVPPNAKPEAVQKIKAKIDDKYSTASDSAFKTLVLRDGYKWFSTQVDPTKAQLSEMDADQARAVARMFNLHPARLGVPGATSYNTLEMAQKDYYDGALSTWLTATKCEANVKLLTDVERDELSLYLDYNINALLWADAKTRNEIAISGIQHGRFSPNETRAWENLDGYDAGDTFYFPLNLAKAGEQSDSTEPGSSSNEDTGSARCASLAMKRLLAEAFQRAVNRVGIKAERAKSYAVEAVTQDRDALIQIIEPSLAVALEAVGELEADARGIAMEWLSMWTGEEHRNAAKVKQDAEAAARVIMGRIFGIDGE